MPWFLDLQSYHIITPSLPSALPFASVHLHLAEVDSTNSHARRLLQDSHPLGGTLITADRQTAGRGQRDRTWQSEPGLDLTCSYILRPTFLAAGRQFLLGAAMAVAVRNAVTHWTEGRGLLTAIKWPNDILVGRQKIAGILIENSLKARNVETSIVGIGLNVNRTAFPDEVNGTSLAILLGTELPLDEVLQVLDRAVGAEYQRLVSMRPSEVMTDYNSHLFGRGEWIALLVNGVCERVKVLGAQDTGLLNLLHEDGRVTEHAHHELDWSQLLTSP